MDVVFNSLIVCLTGALGSLDEEADPRCDAAPSGGSVTIKNGVGCFNRTLIGSVNRTFIDSVASYQCDDGYSLSGNIQRTCLCDGSWNGSMPQCIAVG